MAEIEQDQPSMSEGGTSTADVSNGADSPCPESAADSSSQDLLNRSFTEAGVDLSEDIAAVKAERRDAREGYPSAQSPNGSSSEGTPGNQAAADSSSNGGRSAGRGTVVSDHVSSSTPASGDGCRGSGATAKSIYLDDGPEKKEAAQEPAPARRLTRAEQAALDTLAAFGGAGLGSMEVKKRDLRSELKQEVESRKTSTGNEDGSGSETQLQKIQSAVSDVFGGTSLDTMTEPKRKRERAEEEVDVGGPPKAKVPRRLTKVEQARLEALQSFGGSSLVSVMDGATKRVARTLESAKPKREEEEQQRGEEEEEEQQRGEKEEEEEQRGEEEEGVEG